MMHLWNPLSPRIHIQILPTELRKFPQRINWENLLKGQSILISFSLGDHFLNSRDLYSWLCSDIVRRRLMWASLVLKVLKGQVSTVQRMLIYQNAVSLPGLAVSSRQAIWSCHNVVKEPICTLPWQSLALDQLKYLQIAVNQSTME